MSIDLLFADFDRLIQSPESVNRLRRFILDLAVRGKLVRQNPNDKPASELLKQIAAEKARLVKARKTRKQVPFPSPDASEMSFDLPSPSLTRLPTALVLSTGYEGRNTQVALQTR